MFARMLYTVALAFVVTGFAGAGEGDQPRRAQGGNNQANVILQHADELGLTAEQKTKLQEIAKGPMSVLTDEQKTKAREFIQAARPAGAGAGNGQRRRPNADAAPAKPEEKKPEEKKPEEKKEEK